MYWGCFVLLSFVPVSLDTHETLRDSCCVTRSMETPCLLFAGPACDAGRETDQEILLVSFSDITLYLDAVFFVHFFLPFFLSHATAECL